MLTRTERIQSRIIAAIIVILALVLLTIKGQAQEPQPAAPPPATLQESQQQSQQFYIFADTAGISPLEGNPGMYLTWVFAKTSPTAYPSSGILVVWDCAHSPKLVKRIAQVVYQITSDSSGVTGNIEEVDREWQPVTDTRLAQLVCSIGAQHEANPVQPWLAPGKPRTDS